jgi:sugar lactone lactonase YvrE
MRRILLPVLVFAGFPFACSGPDGDVSRIELSGTGPIPQAAPAGGPLTLVVAARTVDGEAVEGLSVGATVTLGGGKVAPASAVTGPDGTASFAWTLGPAPVANRLSVAAGESTAGFDVRAEVVKPVETASFGAVDAFLAKEGLAGSTEGLAFDREGRLVLGIPGGLVALDPAGAVTRLALTGDPLVSPLGIALDRDGALWVADSQGHALRRVAPDGRVTTVLGGEGSDALKQPNFPAVAPDGTILLSDPCAGTLLRLDPSSGKVLDSLAFDLKTQGGPNGLALDPSSSHVYLTTENTALLCGHADVVADEPIAGLYRVSWPPVSWTLEPVAERVGLFGDGLAFDAEGNLYAIFDLVEDLALKESDLFVLPAGGKTLRKFVSVQGRVLANLAFGTGPYGDTAAYFALLSVPPFTPAEARGAEKLEIGLRGLPLLPGPK